MPNRFRPLALALAGLLMAAPASATITDRELTCAQYLKGAPKSAGRADPAIAGRLRALCAAYPRMKAMDAEIAVSGD